MPHYSDPVHGHIHLTPVEDGIVRCPTYQRLRRIKQLSLANRAYPGADHSRFVHSLGVFHIVSQALDLLAERHPDIVAPHQSYVRAAALLHDVGHYPYSHLFERVRWPTDETSSLVEAVGEGLATTVSGPPDHEEIGRQIIRTQADIRGALDAAGLDPERLIQYLLEEPEQREVAPRSDEGREPDEGVAPRWASQLLHSGLDVDRMDYMLRDSLFTGTPYGHVDVSFICRKLTISPEGNLCVLRPAAAAVEHFVINRWFNWRQIVFHRDVTGVEELARVILTRLAEQGDLLPVAHGEFVQWLMEPDNLLAFDDSYIDCLVRETIRVGGELGAQCEALSNGRVPELVHEECGNVLGDGGQEYGARKERLRAHAGQIVGSGNTPLFWRKSRPVVDEDVITVWDDESEQEITSLETSVLRGLKNANHEVCRLYVVGASLESLGEMKTRASRVLSGDSL